MIIDKIEEFFLKIAEKIGLKKLTDWYREHREGMRYLVFGVLSTIINIVVFAICERILHLSTIISNVIAWIIAVVFAYVTNKLYVFDSVTDTKKAFLKEMISFFVARLLSLGIDVLIMYIGVTLIGINDILTKVIANIVVIIANYVMSKLFIFKRDDSRGEKIEN